MLYAARTVTLPDGVTLVVRLAEPIHTLAVVERQLANGRRARRARGTACHRAGFLVGRRGVSSARWRHWRPAPPVSPVAS